MVADDIDSILNEEEKRIEVEEFKEERERAGRRKGKAPRSTPLGMDEDMELGELEPAELEHIDHHAEARRTIEETVITPGFSKATIKKKIPGQPQEKKSPALKETNSTRKQKERYSKE